MNDSDFPLYDLDDDLIDATRGDRQPRVRVSRPKQVTVILGRGSKAALELDLEACRADGVPVRRRRGGGCSVVLDPGNVVVSAVIPVKGIAGSRCHAEQLTRWVAEGLRRAGFESVRGDGISDLVVDAGGGTARKVAGSCVYRARDVLYYSSSILVAPTVDLMERYLRHPPREPEYRAGRAHGDFVVGLASLAGPGVITVERVAGALEQSLLLAELSRFPSCE